MGERLAANAPAGGEGLQVWVLGGRGMLGRAVVQALQERGIAALATGSEVDITSAEALEAYASQNPCVAWINCAAMTAVDACEDGGAGAAANAAVNGDGPGLLARAARRHGARVLHVSTDYVFAGDATAPYAEDAPCAPKSAYGRAKWAGEQNFWRALGKSASVQGYVVRTAWLFGPWGRNFVATMLKLMGERELLQVVDDQRGRPTYTCDLAHACLNLLGLHGARTGFAPAPPGTYHFANTEAVSWHGFANAILAEARRRALPLACTEVRATDSASFVRPAPRPSYSVLATEKVTRALGVTPRPYLAALRDYFDHPNAFA